MNASHPSGAAVSTDRFRRILLIVDPSVASTPALDRATALARAFGSSLWIGLFDPGPRLGVLGLVHRKEAARFETLMRDQLSERLRALCERLGKEGLSVHAIDHRERASADGIVSQVEQHRIDLVIKDAGHDSAVRRLMFLPLDWELLRQCPVPIWMVGAASSGLPHHVVSALDPDNPAHGAGPFNDSLLDTAKLLAKVCKGRLKVLTAFTGVPPLLAGLQPSPISVSASFDDLYDYLRESHRKALASLLERHGLKPDDAVVLNGGAAQALLGALEGQPADVLVVGMIRRHGLDRLVMGSTVERLVVGAPCDVLAIPAASMKLAVAGVP